jgi:hypothetical protein
MDPYEVSLIVQTLPQNDISPLTPWALHAVTFKVWIFVNKKNAYTVIALIQST